MIGLLITLCISLGYVSGQQTVVSQIVGTQLIPVVLLPTSRDFNRRYRGEPPPQRIQAVRPTVNQFSSGDGSNSLNLNLPQQLTVRENQPRVQFTLPRRSNDRAKGNQPMFKGANTENFTNKTDVEHNSDMHDDVDFKSDRTATSRDKSITTSVPLEQSDVSMKPANGATDNTPSVTEVTLDQRASFDGDKCPKGYIRINGSNECVQPD